MAAVTEPWAYLNEVARFHSYDYCGLLGSYRRNPQHSDLRTYLLARDRRVAMVADDNWLPEEVLDMLDRAEDFAGITQGELWPHLSPPRT